MKSYFFLTITTLGLCVSNSKELGHSIENSETADNVRRIYNSGFELSSIEIDWISQYKGSLPDGSEKARIRNVREVIARFKKSYPNEAITALKYSDEEWFDPVDEAKSIKKTVLIAVFHGNLKTGRIGPDMVTGYLLRGDGELYEIKTK